MGVPKSYSSPEPLSISTDYYHADDDIMSVPVKGSHVLVTGGCGYIGSHTVLELLNRGHDVVIVDDLSNSQEESLNRISLLAGGRAPEFRKVSILDADGLRSVFQEFSIWAVIHFAGYKSVNESIAQPLSYYRNNVWGSCVLLEIMQEFGCKKIVFSSSATVYASGDLVTNGPITENAALGPINPYGRSKYFVEEVIRDVCKADNTFSAVLLRYFNPIGAHPSGLIGEDPKDIPNNLLPYVTQVLVGRRDHLTVHGSDYPTKDGTGVRDFIHVVDLALGHLAALEQLRVESTPHCHTYNMGTGTGYSVLDVVREMEMAADSPVSRKMGPRRPGDAAEVVADPSRANKVLKWRAKRDIRIMCASAYKWQKMNPEGYTPLEESVQVDDTILDTPSRTTRSLSISSVASSATLTSALTASSGSPSPSLSALSLPGSGSISFTAMKRQIVGLNSSSSTINVNELATENDDFVSESDTRSYSPTLSVCSTDSTDTVNESFIMALPQKGQNISEDNFNTPTGKQMAGFTELGLDDMTGVGI